MAFVKLPANKYQSNQLESVQDAIAVEEMLSISINGNPYTITMRTPGNEEALVRGILLTENVYADKEKNPLLLTTEKKGEYVTKVNVIIPEEKLLKGIETKRNLMSVTSCGMCGKEETELHLGPALVSDFKLKAKQVEQMFEHMRAEQNTFEHSGGSHAAAAFTLTGNLLSIKEDIGRHNAVDKVIGDLMLQQTIASAAVLLVSGRLSYEIISKTYRAQIPFLAAVSAPSSLAISTAKEAGICLMAFCRGEKFTVYSHPEKIELP